MYRVHISMVQKSVIWSVELASEIFFATHSKLWRNENNRLFSSLPHEYIFPKISKTSHKISKEMFHKRFLNRLK